MLNEDNDDASDMGFDGRRAIKKKFNSRLVAGGPANLLLLARATRELRRFADRRGVDGLLGRQRIEQR
jgi:hypothetical protein